MEEDECGGGDLGDLVGVEGDVAQCFPGLFQQRVGAFGGCAQRADEAVAGLVVDREVVSLGRDEDADAGTGVALVGQRRQAGGRCGVERGQGVAAGGGDVVGRSGLDRADPFGVSGGSAQDLDVPAVLFVLA